MSIKHLKGCGVISLHFLKLIHSLESMC